MRTLPAEFQKNDLKYRIIDRINNRYLAEVSSESGTIGYETGRILHSKERIVIRDGIEVRYEAIRS